MATTLDIRDLELVREIADAGSVTRAATRLHLTQSALSHRLRSAEERLGTPLFLRVGKRMVLTPGGERVLSSARRVLGELARTEDDVRALGKARAGVLRLCTQCYTGYHWLPPLLHAFHDKHPSVDVQIVVDATPRPVEALLSGEIDLALLTMSVDDGRLAVRPLFRDEMLAIVAPFHPLASRTWIDPAELATEHLLVYQAERHDNYVYTKVFGPAGIEPARVSQVPLTEAILELVKSGLGVAVLARWAVEPALTAGTVRGVRITKRGIIREWSVATLGDRHAPRWQNDFVDLLKIPVAGPRQVRAPRRVAKG